MGNQLTRLDWKKTWLADNRGIFTSLVYPLAKALTYFGSRSNRSPDVMHKPGQEWASVDFYYPVVVISASLFTVDVSRPDPEAVEAPWPTMTREIKTTKVDGQFNIDVVTSDAFERYLDERVNTFGWLSLHSPRRIRNASSPIKTMTTVVPDRGSACDTRFDVHRVRAATAHAALVFDGDECLGWCQCGSPDEVSRIKNHAAYEKGRSELPDWRIGCCYVGKGHRRQGVSAAALAGALELVAGLGGGTVEG